MQRKNILYQKIGQNLVKVAKKFAIVEANTACPLLGYQPKESQAIKKLRKF